MLLYNWGGGPEVVKSTETNQSCKTSQWSSLICASQAEKKRERTTWSQFLVSWWLSDFQSIWVQLKKNGDDRNDCICLIDMHHEGSGWWLGFFPLKRKRTTFTCCFTSLIVCHVIGPPMWQQCCFVFLQLACLYQFEVLEKQLADRSQMIQRNNSIVGLWSGKNKEHTRGGGSQSKGFPCTVMHTITWSSFRGSDYHLWAIASWFTWIV